MTARTKSIRKKRNIFFIISVLTFIIPALVMIFSTLIKFTNKADPEMEAVESLSIFSTQLKTFVLSLSTTGIIAIIASIIIKDKIRTFLWILTTILSAIIYGSTCMYIILGIWLIEEYIFHALYVKYNAKLLVNKELDERENV